jgi:peroxiredoxin
MRLLRLFTGLAASLATCAALAAPTPGSAAPDFTLRSADGHNLRLAEQRGQVVLVNFWASWCGPCREEMPLLDALYRKYHASGFTLLGINIDDDPRNARTVLDKAHLSFPVLLDTDKQVSKRYELSAMPSTVLIDRDGRVRYLNRGYRDGALQAYDQQIRELLKD